MADVEIVDNRDALRELFDSPQGPLAKDLQRRAISVERTAKRLCPVDTGRLRSSITNELASDRGGLYADVGTNVEYGVYVELGTSRAAAQPFLRPAIEAAR